MTTKFDIGDEVLIKARIKMATIEDESHIYYVVNLVSVLDGGLVQVKETDIVRNDHVEVEHTIGRDLR